jgi:hypothetical protein
VSILIAALAGAGVFRLAAACKGLDDDHAAAAAATRTRQHVRLIGSCGLGRLGLFRAGRYGEQLARPFAELDADGVYYGLAAAASLVAAGAPEEKVRFAPDSPLEGDGFEPSVPEMMARFSWASREARQVRFAPDSPLEGDGFSRSPPRICVYRVKHLPVMSLGAGAANSMRGAVLPIRHPGRDSRRGRRHFDQYRPASPRLSTGSQLGRRDRRGAHAIPYARFVFPRSRRRQYTFARPAGGRTSQRPLQADRGGAGVRRPHDHRYRLRVAGGIPEIGDGGAQIASP